MGVRGLTTYVKQRADKYFEEYKLRNCLLVIDGYGLAAVLYNNMIKSNTVFGGDYDRYAKEVETFVNALGKCGVRPVFVFDGGYERKKVETVRKRNEAKMYSLEKVAPSSAQGTHSNYPLMMRQVLRDKLFEMGIALVQSDFEADREIAALARALSCPVLSNDSDFFIYDVLYIPFSTLCFQPARDPITAKHYLKCEVYRVEKFLDDFGGLSKSMLPLLSTLLGNDYVPRRTFKDFYSHIKLPKGKKHSEFQRRIVAILEWLRKETFDTAIVKILSRVKKERRRLLASKMRNVVKVYTNVETPLLAYLPPDLVNKLIGVCDVDGSSFEKELEEGVEKCEEGHSEVSDTGNEASESESSEEEESNDEVEESDICENKEETEQKECLSRCGEIPSWLLEESRKGHIPGCVITLISLKTYFFVPQVENNSLHQAGDTAAPVLAQLCGLLLADHPVNCWGRRDNHYLKTVLAPINRTENYGHFPPLSSLHTLSSRDRHSIFTEIVDVGNDVLGRFPGNWKVFVCSFIYWLKNTVIQPYEAHALLVMVIAVKVFDEKIGYFRNKRPFMQRYGSKLKQLLRRTKEKKDVLDSAPDTNVEEALAKVSVDDCLITFENILQYFHMDENLLYKPKNFSRSLVHKYAEFQACLDMINVLNSVLLHPYSHCSVGSFYNGTFLYNFAMNLKKRSNMLSYMQTIFGTAPAIINLYKTIVVCLEEYLPKNPVVKTKSKKKKKPSTVKVVNDTTEDNQCNVQDSSDSFVDVNNPYSVLQY